MKKINFIFIFLIINGCFFLNHHKSEALVIPDRPTVYVNDYAMILSPIAISQINRDLNQFERETSNQIVIVTFPSLEEESLEDYSIRLAEKWKVGQKGKDNGVIILIFKKEHKIRIEVGYGLEGVLTDALASRIINEDIAPSFRAAKYDEGIFNAVHSIVQITKGEYEEKKLEDRGLSMMIKLIFSVIVVFIISPLLSYLFIIFLCLTYFGVVPGLLIAAFFIGILYFIQNMFFKYYFGLPINSGRFQGGYSGLSFRGGFSGGGGAFGGGGSSGSW